MTPEQKPFSRRHLLKGAGAGGLAAALVPVLGQSKGALGRLTSFDPSASTGTGTGTRTGASGTDGTPEQVHLTWGRGPHLIGRGVLGVARARHPAPAPTQRRQRRGTRDLPAVQRTYTDGINGETVFTYHAFVSGLEPGSPQSYVVTADNDANAGTPFSGSFQTAPQGRAAFRFTSFGDLATPNPEWVLSYGQSTYAVDAVESFQPLFHLLTATFATPI